MQALLLSASLVIILCYLWYASLIKKRQSALDSLNVMDQRMASRCSLLSAILTQSQAHHPQTSEQALLLSELTALQASSRWQQQIDTQLTQVLNTWTLMDRLLSRLFFTVTTDKLDENQLNQYLQFELDYGHAADFYNRAVTDLNQGVQIFPGSIVANIANITTMPLLALSEPDNVPTSGSTQFSEKAK
ncbi:LemA family protein [Shewanella aestuarii]|uniref:LemA family protein n=1 Tax=Shewanella aestuarii TaxID=1028752 RepID=A0A6G9QMY0_9GAMM|nr:LemA family protein [Shewanella aestuarii]QIR15916.1 LemA family protein [Shewanella aestuarii]